MILIYLLSLVYCDEICYYYQECDMGCFTDDPPWGDTDARPTKHLPDPPADIDTTFGLDTQDELGRLIQFGDSTISQSTFNPNNPTIFIIHGYMDKGDEGWLNRVSAGILNLMKANVRS